MRKLDRQKLDEIGKAVVKAGSITPQNIDVIVAKPDLFDSVRQRIALETATRNRPIRFMRPGFAALGALIVVTVASFAFFAFRSNPVPVAVIPITQPPKADEPRRFSSPDNVVVVEKPALRDAAPSRPERVSVSKQPDRTLRSKTDPVRHVDNQGEFYALSYAGDPNETERGSRIVRVDIPRSTLFAMGFDVPLENDSHTVRADLLIGNDGVTRAVRVVK